jgi:mono/diheme cytochrome c family protein
VPLHRDLAARSFNADCASSHSRGADRTSFGLRGPLADGSPDEQAQSILFGVAPEEGAGGVPAFAQGLTDADMTRMVTWLRSPSKPDAPWPDVAARVAAIRATGRREG